MRIALVVRALGIGFERAGTTMVRAIARATRSYVWSSFRKAGPALVMPVLIVGGIQSGLFTPTEAAIVALVSGLMFGFLLLGYAAIMFVPAITLGVPWLLGYDG